MPESLQNSQGAKALAAAFMFMRGLPFIYQGQEIGMTNTAFKSMDEFRDLVASEEYQKALDFGLKKDEALKAVALNSRDNARTPMLWSDGKNAGFSKGDPWIRVHQDYKTLNVQNEELDPQSTLNNYRKLVQLRKDPAYADLFTYGVFIPYESSDDGFIAYKRKNMQQEAVICSNLAEHILLAPLSGKVIYETGGVKIEDGKLFMPSGSAIVMILESTEQK